MGDLDLFAKYSLTNYLNSFEFNKEKIYDITSYCYCKSDAINAVYIKINDQFYDDFNRKLKKKEKRFILEWIDDRYDDDWE